MGAEVRLEDAIQRWRSTLNDAAAKAYPSDVRRLQRRFGEDVLLNKLTTTDLSDFFSWLPDNTTKPRIIAAVRNLFRFLRRQGDIPDDPAEDAILSQPTTRLDLIARDAGRPVDASKLTYLSWLSPILNRTDGTPLEIDGAISQISPRVWSGIARELAVALERAESARDVRNALDQPIAKRTRSHR